MECTMGELMGVSSILDKQSPRQKSAGAIHLCDGLPDRWAFECKQSGTMQGGEQRVQEYLGSNSLEDRCWIVMDFWAFFEHQWALL